MDNKLLKLRQRKRERKREIVREREKRQRENSLKKKKIIKLKKKKKKYGKELRGTYCQSNKAAFQETEIQMLATPLSPSLKGFIMLLCEF